MDIRRRVGANVKAARKAKGWSQEELADRARMHRTYISGIERGIRNPTITVLERVGKALEISPGSLLNGA
jgi:transcriptional regulator with XRE-family HTH domain